MKTYVKAVSYYTPDKIITNADIIEDFPDWSEGKISNKLGIDKRFDSENKTAGDLAECAANKLFEEHYIDRNTIDALILCTQSPDYFLPTTACILQNKLGLPRRIVAFDFNLGCSGFVYGLGIAKGLQLAGIAKNVLLLTAETYQKYIHPKDRGNRALFSDAAAATLVSTEGFAEIKEFSFGTDGSGYRNLIVESGAHRMRGKQETKIISEGEFERSPDYLYMNGPEVLNFTLEAVPQLVNEVLYMNNLDLSDIDLFIFHQANKHLLKYIREAVGIPEEKFYSYLTNIGNTVSSTIPIALYHALSERRACKSMNILITGFGVGYSWGGVILRM